MRGVRVGAALLAAGLGTGLLVPAAGAATVEDQVVCDRSVREARPASASSTAHGSSVRATGSAAGQTARPSAGSGSALNVSIPTGFWAATIS